MFLRIPILLSCLALFTTLGQAQHALLLYQQSHNPQRVQLQPAHVPSANVYVGLPFLSNLRFGAANSGFTIADIDAADAGPEFDYELLQSRIGSDAQNLFGTGAFQLLSAGFRVGSGYIHLVVSDEFYTSGTYDEAIFNVFADVEQMTADPFYDLSQLDLEGAYYRSYGIGYAHQLTEAFSVGGRVRFLQGVGAINSNNEDLAFQLTVQNDFFQVLGNWQLQSSGLGPVIGDEERSASEILFPSGNGGFALDLGANYRISEQLSVSASVLNLGSIDWTEDLQEVVVDDALNFSATDIDENLDEWEEVTDSLINGAIQGGGDAFSTTLPTTFYLAGNYRIRPQTQVGIVVNPVSYGNRTELAAALTASNQFGNWFHLIGALNYQRTGPVQVGLGFTIDAGFFQLFSMTESLGAFLNAEDASTLHAQAGISFQFGRNARERSEAVRNLPGFN